MDLVAISLPGRWMVSVERAEQAGWLARLTTPGGTTTYWARWRWQARREASRMCQNVTLR